MIKLGLTLVNDNELWVSSTGVPDFFDVFFHQRQPGTTIWYYKDPASDKYLNLNLTDRNPLNTPVDKENLTADELEFKQEYQTRLTRKDQSQPLVRLSSRHLEALTKLIGE